MSQVAFDPNDLPQEETLRDLLANRFEWPHNRWSAGHRSRHFHKKICDEICRKQRALCRRQDYAYGSGTASFMDLWFYRDTPDFARETRSETARRYVGVWALLHLDWPLCVLGEGSKSWAETTSGGYLPTLERVDCFRSEATAALAAAIGAQLADLGFVRLTKTVLSAEPPLDLRTPNNLSDKGDSIFAVLFHWWD